LSLSDGPKREPVIFEPDDLLVDRFRIVRSLGNGRFGSVYLAEDLTRSVSVALKAMQVLSGEQGASRFRREMAGFNAILDCRHVIRVHDLHVIPRGGSEVVLLSMEYAEGGSFKDWLSKHKNDLETRRTTGVEYFKQACRGVGAIHDAGLLHLDLKPANLLLSGGVLKVSDLGASSSRLWDQSTWDESATCMGEGTPLYMSPEHFQAAHPDDLDERSDIFSLGIILFELLHPKCRPPFWGNLARLRELHTGAATPQLRDIGSPQAEVVGRSLSRDPLSRYQSVWDLIQDLEKDVITNSPPPSDHHEPEPEIRTMLEEASESIAGGDLKAATKLLDRILSIAPDHTEAGSLKEELQSRYEESAQLYQEISDRLDREDINQSAEWLAEAIELYPEHPCGPPIQRRFLAKAKQYGDAMESGVAALKEGDFESAHALLEQACRHRPNDAIAKSLIQRLSHIKGMRQSIDQAIIEKRFEDAKHLAACADHEIGRLLSL